MDIKKKLLEKMRMENASGMMEDKPMEMEVVEIEAEPMSEETMPEDQRGPRPEEMEMAEEAAGAPYTEENGVLTLETADPELIEKIKALFEASEDLTEEMM